MICSTALLIFLFILLLKVFFPEAIFPSAYNSSIFPTMVLPSRRSSAVSIWHMATILELKGHISLKAIKFVLLDFLNIT